MEGKSVNTLECALGICGKDFIMLGADLERKNKDLTLLAHDVEKIHKITDSTVLAFLGYNSEIIKIVKALRNTVNLAQIQFGYTLSVEAIFNRTRAEIFEANLNREAIKLDCIAAGYDHHLGPKMHHMNFKFSKQVSFIAVGDNSEANMVKLYQLYTEDITQEKAYDAIKICLDKMILGSKINLKKFVVHILDKDGMRPYSKMKVQDQKWVCEGNVRSSPTKDHVTNVDKKTQSIED